VVGEIEVIAEVTRKPHQDDSARDKHERAHQENALAEALKDTFPASDPVSVEQPTPPAADRVARRSPDRRAQCRPGAILGRSMRRR
jgi:hypothetical protein